MSEVTFKLDKYSIQAIAMFESATKAKVRDCIINDNKIIFVVSEGHAGRAIGKNGYHVKRLEKKFNKKIEVIEFSKDPKKFIVNILRPTQVKSSYVSEHSDGTKVLHAKINTSIRAFPSKKVKKAKNLLNKYFPNLDKVEVKV